MSASDVVDLDAFDGPASLTELFETDALLDALGGRDATYPATYPELLDRTGRRSEPDRALALLRALTASLDADLADLPGIRELDGRPAADPEAEPQTAALLYLVPRAHSRLSCARDLVDADRDEPASRGSAFLRVAGRVVPRHLPRANRFVAAAAGAMIVLSGGGLAAAATTAPGHGWGPLAPLSRALHPGWTDDGLAAKRAVVLRELEQALQQSRSGQKSAATATYNVATRRAQDLPSGPDATLQAKLAVVAQQLGLTGDSSSPASTEVAVPVLTSDPVGVDPTDPLGGPLPTTPVTPPTDDTLAPPTTGTAPGTLPPAPPTDAGAPSGTEPGAGVGSAPADPTPPPTTTPTDPGTPPVTGGTPPPSDGSQPPSDPTSGSTTPVGTGTGGGGTTINAPVTGDPADSTTATTGATDPSTPPATGTTDPTTPPATGTTDPTTPPATGTTDPTTPPATGVTDPAPSGHHHAGHAGRHRAHTGKHRNPPPGPVVTPGVPVETPPADPSSGPSPDAPADTTSASSGSSSDVTSDTSTA